MRVHLLRTAGATEEVTQHLGVGVDHDRDGRLDLTVGAPGENATGAVTTLRGSGKNFTTSGAKTFDITLSTYPTPTGARFGSVLAR